MVINDAQKPNSYPEASTSRERSGDTSSITAVMGTQDVSADYQSEQLVIDDQASHLS